MDTSCPFDFCPSHAIGPRMPTSNIHGKQLDEPVQGTSLTTRAHLDRQTHTCYILSVPTILDGLYLATEENVD